MLLLFCKCVLIKPGCYTDKRDWGKQTHLSECTTFTHCAHLESCVNTFKRKTHDPSLTSLSLSREHILEPIPPAIGVRGGSSLPTYRKKQPYAIILNYKSPTYVSLECRWFLKLYANMAPRLECWNFLL